MDFKLKNSNLNISVRTTQKIPETGKENDIIVISEVPMTNWILSPDAPRGAPRNDGDVWLTYSVGGNAFNALKQSTLMIAMVSAKQYIDGAWVNKTAKSYQNGEWVDVVYYLFKSGYGSDYSITKYSDKNASITVSDDRIAFYALSIGSNGYIGNVLNLGPFDATDKNTLCVDMEYVTASAKFPEWYPAVGVSQTEWTDFDKHLTSNCVKFENITFARKIVKLPIESFSDEMYFVWNGSGEANIYNIWLE